MSFTANDHLYASLHETGGNEFVKAIYKQRPRYFSQGSLADPLTGTVQGKILGFDWLAEIGLPTVNFYPFPALPSPHPGPIPGQFLISFRMHLTGFSYTNELMDINAVAVAVANASPSPGKMGFKIIDLEVTQYPLLKNVVMLVLNLALSAFSIPYPAFPLGAFTPVLSAPPIINGHKFILKGNL
ncbi:MAG TPA: hypothetical protein VF006_04685 [Longimicrobium sp.]